MTGKQIINAARHRLDELLAKGDPFNGDDWEMVQILRSIVEPVITAAKVEFRKNGNCWKVWSFEQQERGRMLGEIFDDEPRFYGLTNALVPAELTAIAEFLLRSDPNVTRRYSQTTDEMKNP